MLISEIKQSAGKWFRLQDDAKIKNLASIANDKILGSTKKFRTFRTPQLELCFVPRKIIYILSRKQDVDDNSYYVGSSGFCRSLPY